MLDKKHLSHKGAEYLRDITSIGNPILLLLITISIISSWKALIVFLLGYTCAELITNFLKYVIHSERPQKQEYTGLLSKLDSRSFPSIHVTRVTYTSLFLVSINYNLKVLITGIIFIVIISISRVLLRKHILVDVIGGIILGIILSITFTNFV
jgi:membrane-associated phospholipid phosphatase